jgi:hypothetical protein
MQNFYAQLSPEQSALFNSLSSPIKIQAYLDSIPYIGEDRDRSPLSVLQDEQCHCLDGGLFAAAALRKLGYSSRLIDLVPEESIDDDHVLAIFQEHGCYGAIAKSNFVGLRFREPVYRSIRELVMSYFVFFFNLDGLKTLRGYTRPVNLARFDQFNWSWDEAGVAVFSRYFYNCKVIPILNPEQIESLSPVDSWTYAGGTLGTNLSEVYGSR